MTNISRIKNGMKTKPYKIFFCKRYGQLAGSVCRRLSSDDWDELEDCCQNCSSKGTIETDVEIFKVKCKKDTLSTKESEIVDAYVWGEEHFVVNGAITHINEFKEHFEIL